MDKDLDNNNSLTHIKNDNSYISQEELYNLHYDDSSDEEINTEIHKIRRTTAKIKLGMPKLKEEEIKEREIKENNYDVEYSIDNYLAGYKLLNHKLVQKIYYPLKRKFFNNTLLPGDDELYDIFIDITEDSLKENLLFLSDENYNKMSLKSYENFENKTLKSLKNGIDDLADTLVNNKREIFYATKHEPGKFLDCIEDEINYLILELECELENSSYQLSKDKEEIYQDISFDIVEKLSEKFKDLGKNNFRVTLGNLYTHTVTNIIDYLSSLKITNRNATRTMRNISEDKIFEKYREETHFYSWKFNTSFKYSALHKETITPNGRTAKINIKSAKDSYKELHNLIIELNKIKISDSQIATWIRQIINGEEIDFISSLSFISHDELYNFLVNLSHLFYGLEGIRYPASFIEHNMILDLIIEEKISFKEVFTFNLQNTFMPMSVPTATNLARTISNKFNEYLGVNYNYYGKSINWNDNNIKLFIEAEERVSEAWLEMVKSKTPDLQGKSYSDILEANITKWHPDLKNSQSI